MTAHYSAIVTVAVLLAAGVAAAGLTGLSRTYALRRALLDIPNERSSHSVPTPRGGGLAIAVTLAAGMSVLGMAGVVQAKVVWALLGGGGLVAGIGWLDDHRHVPPRWRALVHAAAAVWAVVWLGGLSLLWLGGETWQVGWLGSLLAVIAIVWLINLYNFMDGIDALAGLEAVTAGLGAAALLWWAGNSGLAAAAALVAVCCVGFLWWNWPPARIFMGDVGSGLLGYCFAVLALAGEKSGDLPGAVWLILLAVFVLDATFTLIARVLRGERWYTAHRSHAYQRGVQLGCSHRRVSVAVGGINMLILFPLAVAAVAYPMSQPWLAGLVVIMAWLLWKAVQNRYRNSSRGNDSSNP
ncbi:MAG: glycosyltransferase family 4 protein [Gammaproteobacteria bacterium]